jgi:hypothetical protein
MSERATRTGTFSVARRGTLERTRKPSEGIAMRNHAASYARRAFALASLVAPVLIAYLYVGACGHGKRGVVVTGKAFGISVAAAWCSAT